MSGIQVGDTVKVTGGTLEYFHGRTGEVIRIDELLDFGTVWLVWLGQTGVWVLKPEYLQLVKKGDTHE